MTSSDYASESIVDYRLNKGGQIWQVVKEESNRASIHSRSNGPIASNIANLAAKPWEVIPTPLNLKTLLYISLFLKAQTH